MCVHLSLTCEFHIDSYTVLKFVSNVSCYKYNIFIYFFICLINTVQWNTQYSHHVTFKLLCVLNTFEWSTLI